MGRGVRIHDQWGKILCHGGDYIPEDCVYNRITRERMEYLVRSSVKAHYNCLRVWGGGYYPSDEFYDLCDEYGIIVWQDLMYACNVYDVTQEFEDSIAAETADNAKRLRHHASLGLWCGNNEIESAWASGAIIRPRASIYVLIILNNSNISCPRY